MTIAREEGTARSVNRKPRRSDREVVLVVDDEVQVLQLLKRVLERAGFETITVDDGRAAHEAAVEWRPDIILLDLMLGSTTGDQVLAELRKDFRTRLIPVVFLTVRSSIKDKVEHLMAGELSPLTGMSGNSDIMREISHRLHAQEFACLYPDIDNFKSYNDHYGFIRGDDVIKTLASIILEVLEENYSPSHFAGHVGGDDFVILTNQPLAEDLASEITRRFDREVPALYDVADRERGWIESEDRTGHTHRTPLVSLSIGIVMSKPGNFSSAPALASRAAEVKGVAKRIPGSKWIIDRRRPPETRLR